MPAPQNLQAFGSEIEIWQRALESPRGIRVPMPDSAAATRLRQRLFQARERQRKEHRKVFAPDDLQYGKSFYEAFSIKIEGTALIIARNEVPEIEEL